MTHTLNCRLVKINFECKYVEVVKFKVKQTFKISVVIVQFYSDIHVFIVKYYINTFFFLETYLIILWKSVVVFLNFVVSLTNDL